MSNLFGYPDTDMPKKISNIKNLSGYYAYRELNGVTVIGYPILPPHNNKFNVLFFDGHVKMTKNKADGDV